MKPNKQNAIVLISGGIDSATALWWAKSKRFMIRGVTFNYHNRNIKEIEASKLIALKAECDEYNIIDLPFMRDLEDLPNAPTQLKKTEKKVSSSYIPSKNNIFYSIAASLAESVGASWIIGGHHHDDQSQFPDSTPKYFEQLNFLLKTSLASYKESPIKIINPLSTMNKSEVIKLSLELEAPLELTWSCYTNQKQTCGICRSCISRKNAFNNLNIVDPADI